MTTPGNPFNTLADAMDRWTRIRDGAKEAAQQLQEPEPLNTLPPVSEPAPGQ